MPWLTIIITVLSFIASKKGGATTAQAAGIAALAGAGTYAVTHGTEWGRENLGRFDGVLSGTGDVVTTRPVLDADGNRVPKRDAAGAVIVDKDGRPIYETKEITVPANYDPNTSTVTSSGSSTITQEGQGGLSGWWKSIGSAGQTLVGAGVGAAAATTMPSWVLPAGLLLGAYLILK